MATETIKEFFEERVPAAWFVGSPSIESDEEEILCVGLLPPGGAPDTFRESTRQERMAIAREAEARFRRTVSWGVEHDGATTLFTTHSSPVMTRLRLRERAVLETLIDAGIARSKSEALAWCVKLVERHQSDWLAELREALVGVEQVRVGGPSLI
ncbi:MAG TPA: hypothetical protein VHS57_02095 [Acidimicrobiales bacterium]|jgi:hypothetical protein|nr:hypothetical protein [Acidimicrobiales bacterium]